MVFGVGRMDGLVFCRNIRCRHSKAREDTCNKEALSGNVLFCSKFFNLVNLFEKLHFFNPVYLENLFYFNKAIK